MNVYIQEVIEKVRKRDANEPAPLRAVNAADNKNM